MSLELRKKSPEELILEAMKALEADARHSARKAEEYFGRFPEVKDHPDVKHSTGSTHERLAGVYRRYAETLGDNLEALRRDEVRATNPLFADCSDAEIDVIIAQMNSER